mmetsp:Transcript_8291/g.37552  ORF Transcript_8291/g.37552 Transcript_8291/m.37552 type:complete len:332 (+) Transcript_8291:2676-3671(+)
MRPRVLASRHAEPAGAEVLAEAAATGQRLLQRLGEPAKSEADVLDALQPAKDPGPEQHPLLHARVEEALVRVDELVHALRVPQRRLEGVPVGLDHLAHEIVGEVLQKVEHALAQHVRAAEGTAVARARRLRRRRACRLVRLPRLAQPPLDVLAVKHVTKEQLILGDGAPGQHEGHRPRRVVVERERLEARQAKRLFRGHLRFIRVEVEVRVGGCVPLGAAGDVNGEQLVDDPLAFQRARQVVVVRVRARGGQLQRELQEGLQPGDGDVGRPARELLARVVREVHEKVPFVEEKVSLHRAEPAVQVAVAEHRAKQPDGRVPVRGVDSRRVRP